MIFAGIVAGGTGTRMGTGMPKQFIEIGGRPIIIRTIERFASVSAVDIVLTAIHPDWLEYTQELTKNSLDKEKLKKLRIIPGGSDRNASVFRIIDAAKKLGGLPDDIILTHDAVRPLVTEEIILNNISCAGKYPACTTAVPATDTILCSDDSASVTETPDRSKLYHAQTPQSFTIGSIENAYSRLNDDQKKQLTDVCGIFTLSGGTVHIVPGDVSNIKITTPFDLKIAEALLR